jgi:hypothetical protein
VNSVRMDSQVRTGSVYVTAKQMAALRCYFHQSGIRCT